MVALTSIHVGLFIFTVEFLICLNGVSVRLVGGKHPYEGRIEIYHKGRYGTICNDFFDENAAKVICRQLNYGIRKPTAIRLSTDFGQANGPIWLDNVRCKGNEAFITECQHSEWNVTNCNHDEDVAIECGIDCDFENNGTCGWTTKGMKVSNELFLAKLPKYKERNHVLFAEFVKKKQQGNGFELESPFIQTEGKCLSFFYFATTNGPRLSISLQNNTIWTANNRVRNQSAWKEALIQLPISIGSYQNFYSEDKIDLESPNGYSKIKISAQVQEDMTHGSLLAVDDIELHDALCTFQCDFTNSFCGAKSINNTWQINKIDQTASSINSNIQSFHTLKLPGIIKGKKCIVFSYKIFGQSLLEVTINGHVAVTLRASGRNWNQKSIKSWKSSVTHILFTARHSGDMHGAVVLNQVAVFRNETCSGGLAHLFSKIQLNLKEVLTTVSSDIPNPSTKISSLKTFTEAPARKNTTETGMNALYAVIPSTTEFVPMKHLIIVEDSPVKNHHSKRNVIAIVAIVCGSIIGLVIIIILSLFLRQLIKHRLRKHKPSAEIPGPYAIYVSNGIAHLAGLSNYAESNFNSLNRVSLTDTVNTNFDGVSASESFSIRLSPECSKQDTGFKYGTTTSC